MVLEVGVTLLVGALVLYVFLGFVCGVKEASEDGQNKVMGGIKGAAIACVALCWFHPCGIFFSLAALLFIAEVCGGSRE